MLYDKSNISVIVDKNWRKLWNQRMEKVLDDAETMKIDNNDNIIELGKKTNSFQDIQGQYIGLIKFSKNIINDVRKFYHRLDQTSYYDGKNFDNMYMTSFLQQIIEKLMPIKAVFVSSNWMEFDKVSDLSVDVDIGK